MLMIDIIENDSHKVQNEKQYEFGLDIQVCFRWCPCQTQPGAGTQIWEYGNQWKSSESCKVLFKVPKKAILLRYKPIKKRRITREIGFHRMKDVFFNGGSSDWSPVKIGSGVLCWELRFLWQGANFWLRLPCLSQSAFRCNITHNLQLANSNIESSSSWSCSAVEKCSEVPLYTLCHLQEYYIFTSWTPLPMPSIPRQLVWMI